MSRITDSLGSLRQRIADTERTFSRAPGSVRLLAVSKTRPTTDIEAAYQGGQEAFGESYLQEALEKVEALSHLALEWHFIGPIQANKTRPIAGHFHWVHSVDRLKVARRLSDQRPVALPPLNVCLQLNMSGEPSKAGVPPEAVPELASAVAALPRLCLRGLMTIPAPDQDFERQRVPFRQLRAILTDLNHRGLALDTLSMGMTADLEAAIAEGATIVRVGTAIFGPRT